MKKIRYLLTIFLVFAVIAASCGGDGDDEATEEDTSTEETTEDTAADDTTEDTAADEGEAMDEGGEVVTDFGVDPENKVINVGLNADLSGPFAALVSEIVAGQEVYWEVFNEAGGYQGWTVETQVIDSGYQTDIGIQNYETFAQESEDGVLMITENTGSPITSAIAAQAAEDNVLVIPLSWASLWPDPEFGAAILEKQTTYCIESMNGVEWLKGYVEDQGLEPSLAILTRPGEYGEDGAAGAKIAAEELGIPIAYDGTSAVAGDDRTGVIAELVGSGATMVWTTLTPGELLDIFGNAVSQGFDGFWSGNGPSFSYPVHMPSDFADEFDQYYFQSGYAAAWGTEGIPEYDRLVAEMTARRPDLNISDQYATGWIEGIMAETLIKAAIDEGDLTRANMVELATSGLEVDFGGISAAQSWPNDYNEAVVRSSWIYDVSVPDFNLIPLGDYTPEEPGGTGLVAIEQDYVGSVAADYQFDGPCITPSG
ncbi:MAG: ABC transporter substrate-binding protein [Acidimicrobiia bacterium]|nr:ABC transporter substrate-binding protein [Acidimicrobiia bacterium]